MTGLGDRKNVVNLEMYSLYFLFIINHYFVKFIYAFFIYISIILTDNGASEYVVVRLDGSSSALVFDVCPHPSVVSV